MKLAWCVNLTFLTLSRERDDYRPLLSCICRGTSFIERHG
jgi:hypothetical protein